jgi:hypothetical protein
LFTTGATTAAGGLVGSIFARLAGGKGFSSSSSSSLSSSSLSSSLSSSSSAGFVITFPFVGLPFATTATG